MKMFKASFFGIVVASVIALTGSSRCAWAVHETELTLTYMEKIAPYFDQGFNRTILGKDQVALNYRIYPSSEEKAKLVILPGRGEPIHKYAELIYDMKDLGFSIYIFEHRGQGESGLVKKVKSQYVSSFQDYLIDLDLFLEREKLKNHPKVFLLGHSMGGFIGTLYEKAHPGTFQALVLSAPMFDMNTHQFKKKESARKFGEFMCSIGLEKCVAHKDEDQFTSSEVRDRLNAQISDKFSSIRWRDISFRWALSALKALEENFNTYASLNLPILMLQAGKDLHVPAEGQNLFCDQASHCHKVIFPTSYHEILMEADFIRSDALHKIQRFLSSQL